jgi:hypothetical protein
MLEKTDLELISNHPESKTKQKPLKVSELTSETPDTKNEVFNRRRWDWDWDDDDWDWGWDDWWWRRRDHHHWWLCPNCKGVKPKTPNTKQLTPIPIEPIPVPTPIPTPTPTPTPTPKPKPQPLRLCHCGEDTELVDDELLEKYYMYLC